MKDLTSTSFGLVIAFLLPGLTGLYSLSFWSESLNTVFAKFLTAESNVGLFLLVILASLAMGLQLTLLRWLIFERFLCRSIGLDPDDFRTLHEESRLPAYRAAVDEHYRYHQFWGGMAMAIPIFFFGWITNHWTELSSVTFWSWIIFAVSVEFVTGYGAVAAYRNYVKRSRFILVEQASIIEGE